jgi:hypothetical protein
LLEQVEKKVDDRLFIEREMSAAFLLEVLGKDWFRSHVALSDSPDTWMLNASEKWIDANPVSPPDLRALFYSNRIVRLAGAWFTLLDNGFDGTEALLKRFQRRDDTRAVFMETEIASLLSVNGCGVRVIEETGVRGRDYDLSATYHGVETSIEVTAISHRPLSIKTTLNRLQDKRSQVPDDKPAVLYIHVPLMWINNYVFAQIVLDTAVRRFFFKSRRYNMIVFMWERAMLGGDHGRVELKIQPVYNSWARFDLPDRNVFSVKRDKWGLSRCSKSFFEALLVYRMSKQPTTERDSQT